jgi:tRNA pseudouridine55 synthase
MSAPAAPRPRRRVDGVLLVDKPAGRSSNAILQHVKWLYAAQKAGHTGTLDPLASGLLPICFGEATKFAQVLLDAGKAYVATVRFGVATSTGDAEGDIVSEHAMDFDRGDLERVLPRFTGTISQVPPRHSALKYRGRSHYVYARAGIPVPRLPRSVEIRALDLLDWAPPLAVLRVACGKGAYIRTLAEDIAAALGSGAHLAALRRTASGEFSIADAVGFDALDAMDVAARDRLLLPVHAALAGIPRLDVDAEGARALRHGKVRPAAQSVAGRHCCFDPEDRFLGLVEVDATGIRAIRLASTAEPSRG